MTRLAVPARDDAPEASRPILDAVNRQLGVIPNLYRVIANSPATLTGFAGLQGALTKALDARTRERIALAVAQVNGCDYCLSAHTYLGLNVARLSPEEIALNRKGASGEPRAHAAVHFATSVARERGKVGDAELAAVRAAGITDAQIVEIVGLVAENSFTNYLNNVAKTDIDFPIVLAADAA
jgi:uncharacterized peroxidase-related enzyme